MRQVVKLNWILPFLPALFAGFAFASESPATTRASVSVQDALADSPHLPERAARQKVLVDKALAAATRSIDRAAAQLSLANHLIALPPSGAATRWILDVAAPEDRQLLTKQAESARQALQRASDALKEADEADKERRQELRVAADVLAGFTSIFELPSRSGEGEEFRKACSEAALELASARESDDPAIAAAALLWQSFAWELAGRRDRALATLPDAMARPREGSYDFLARLLRCRLVAANGEHAAAIGLLIRVRALCEKWFASEGAESISARQRLTMLEQLRVTSAWLDKLRGSRPGVVEPLEKMRDELAGRLGEQNPRPVYLLPMAVPQIVEAPDIETEPAATSPSADKNETSTSGANTP